MSQTSEPKIKNKKRNKNDSKRDKNFHSPKNQKNEEENIMDFFVFDENEDNIIINPKQRNQENAKMNHKEEQKNDLLKENKMKVDYNVSSFITSSFRPDLYSPFGIISGNKYKLKFAPSNSFQSLEEKEEDNEKKDESKNAIKKEENKEKDSSSSSSDEKENNEEIKKMKLNRYYNIEPDISLKCHICDQVGHRKDACPFYDSKFCYRCLSTSHEDRDCEQIKCFKCNKLGHKTYYCELRDNQLVICDSCHCVGHVQKECLIKPMEFSSKFLKYNDLSCLYCGSSNHVLCSLIERELPELKEEDEDEDEINEILKDEYLFRDSLNKGNNDEDEDDDRSSLTPKDEDLEKDSNNKVIEIEEETIDLQEYESMNNQNKEKERTMKKKKEKIFEDIENEDIKNTMFCGYCGDRHRNEECEHKNDEKFNNKFDEQRKNTGKKLIEKRRKEKEEKNTYKSLLNRKRENDSYHNNNINKSEQRNINKKSRSRNNDFYKDRDRDRDKDKNRKWNKNVNWKEDDLREDENNYNKITREKYFENQKKSKSENYQNLKIREFNN